MKSQRVYYCACVKQGVKSWGWVWVEVRGRERERERERERWEGREGWREYMFVCVFVSEREAHKARYVLLC